MFKVKILEVIQLLRMTRSRMGVLNLGESSGEFKKYASA